MGYRSEVILAIKLPEHKLDDLAISYREVDRKLAIELLRGLYKENPSRDLVNIRYMYGIINKLYLLWSYWGDVFYLKDNNFVLHLKEKKWYTNCQGYENVTETVKLIESLQRYFNEQFTFIRLGEDSDDVRELGNAYIYTVSKTVSYNG